MGEEERESAGQACQEQNLSLHTLVHKHLTYLQRYVYNPSPETERRRAEQEFWACFNEFVKQQGTLVNFYLCVVVDGGVVYTRTDRRSRGIEDDEHKIHLVLPTHSDAPAWIAELLLACHSLHIHVRQVLHSTVDGPICMEMIFVLATQLLRLLDYEAYDRQQRKREAAEKNQDAPPHAESGQLMSRMERDQRVYSNQLATIRAIYDRSAQRIAQTQYFLGMMLGVLVVSLVMLVLYAIRLSAVLPEISINLLLMSFSIGGLGAIVSVMQRMTAGTLRLRHHAGKSMLLLAGVFRPLIGAVFAAVIFAVLMAGLLPSITTPDPTNDVQKAFFFFGALAFFAGFSERWAQDMLTIAQPRPAATEDDGSSQRRDGASPASADQELTAGPVRR